MVSNLVLRRLNANQEQIMFFIYDLRNTPERGVGPDPRLTENGLSEGIGLPLAAVKAELLALKNKAFIRAPIIGNFIYHYLTPKGFAEMEKVQQRTIKVGLSGSGLNAGFEQTEIKGIKSKEVGENRKT